MFVISAKVADMVHADKHWGCLTYWLQCFPCLVQMKCFALCRLSNTVGPLSFGRIHRLFLHLTLVHVLKVNHRMVLLLASVLSRIEGLFKSLQLDRVLLLTHF